jgi:hypothetical protein
MLRSVPRYRAWPQGGRQPALPAAAAATTTARWLDHAQTARTRGRALLRAGHRPLLGRGRTPILSPRRVQTSRQVDLLPGSPAARTRARQGSGARGPRP